QGRAGSGDRAQDAVSQAGTDEDLIAVSLQLSAISFELSCEPEDSVRASRRSIPADGHMPACKNRVYTERGPGISNGNPHKARPGAMAHTSVDAGAGGVFRVFLLAVARRPLRVGRYAQP